MDAKDLAILSALEKDARISLKQLARRLNLKVNTIYYRLQKLQNSSILQNFTISIDPIAMGASLQAILTIHISPFQIESLNSTFLENFARSLADEFDELSFISIAGNNTLMAVSCFFSPEHMDDVVSVLTQNPHVDNIDVMVLNKVVKGTKVFNLITSNSNFWGNQGAEEEFEEDITEIKNTNPQMVRA